MKEPVVAICTPVYENPSMSFWRSFRQLWKPHKGGQIEGVTHLFDAHGILVDKARQILTDAALNASPEVTHLLWVDADMTMPPNALKRLLGHRVPIVGGLCFNRRSPYQPILLREHPGELARGSERYGFCYHYPPDDLFSVDATGSAFMLVERNVYERIQKEFGPTWYNPIHDLSEDLSFCWRAKRCGFPIHVDTGLKIGHVAEVVVDEEFAEKNRPYQWDAWRPVSGEVPEGESIASVVIPTFNQNPEYLNAAVLSAAYQTVPVEVIVVDDGSSEPVDDTRWPENVRLIRFDSNKGISEALNAGIAEMRTPWFCWLSSDDILDPRKVELQLAACEQGNFKASFTRWQAAYTEEKQTRIASLERWRNIPEQMAVLSQFCAIFGSTVMIHRTVFEALGGFDPHFKYSQDWEMWCRVGQHTFWYGFDEILATRREHDNLTARIEADPKKAAARDAENAQIRKRYGR